jgi:antitoxin (DNA-binding transcriptional repressor) of toxin-antitoxin stability system
MTTLTIRDFRSNLAASFDLVDKGESVLVRRRGKIYTIVVVEDDELEITPQLSEKIEKAREEYRVGRALAFESAAAAQQWMNEL